MNSRYTTNRLELSNNSSYTVRSCMFNHVKTNDDGTAIKYLGKSTIHIFLSTFQQCTTTKNGTIYASSANLKCINFFQNSAYHIAIFYFLNGANVSYSSSNLAYQRAYAINNFGINGYTTHFNSSNSLCTYQTSLANFKFENHDLRFNLFINCGYDKGGASLQLYKGNYNVEMCNFINITTDSVGLGFLTVGNGTNAIFSQCYFEVNCTKLISMYDSNSHEKISISSSSFVCNAAVSHSILTTNDVVVSQNKDAITYVSIPYFEDVQFDTCNPTFADYNDMFYIYLRFLMIEAPLLFAISN